MKKLFVIVSFLFCVSFVGTAKEIIVGSPDGKLEVKVSEEEQRLAIEVFRSGNMLFEVKDIFLDTNLGIVPEQGAVVRKVTKTSVDDVVIPEIKEKTSTIVNRYNEAIIAFKDKSSLIVRVYDNGVAYRIHTAFDSDIIVKGESSRFVFNGDDIITYQQDKDRHSSNESPYVNRKISELNADMMGNLPALVEKPNGECVLVLESDVNNYPVMWLKGDGENINSYFWNYPKSFNIEGSYYNKGYVKETEDFIAKTSGKRDFPWRVFAVEQNAAKLVGNQLVYLLAPECKIEDTSWIKPGWVTFDWWARYEIYGVDFKSGLNTATSKYMIDFAAEYGVPYFLVDDFWFKDNDLTKSIADMNVSEIASYGTSKGVGVMLWVPYTLFDEQMEKTCKQYSEWGIKGVKIDFINRSDQKAIDFCRRAAEVCAKYNLVIDFHGVFSPDGMRREYPNVLTREALIEFEYSGGGDIDNPDHHCTLPFIRNVAGPMDYIPATMNNAAKGEFRPVGQRPMGQGTRAHAMALAVVCESPMQMLPDGPSDYYREAECSRFVTSIPVEWDEILPIDGKVGDYITLARRKGNDWYIAAITDWSPRDKKLTLDFLDSSKEYEIEIFKDGANADMRGIDYKREVKTVKRGDVLDVKMASGGGWIAKISVKK